MNANDVTRSVVTSVEFIGETVNPKTHNQFANGGKVGSPKFPTLLISSIAQPPNAEGDYPSRDSGDQSGPVWQSPDDLSCEIGTETLQQETSGDADGADESPIDP